MSAMASQIIGISIVYSTVCSGADQRNTNVSKRQLGCRDMCKMLTWIEFESQNLNKRKQIFTLFQL